MKAGKTAATRWMRRGGAYQHRRRCYLPSRRRGGTASEQAPGAGLTQGHSGAADAEGAARRTRLEAARLCRVAGAMRRESRTVRRRRHHGAGRAASRAVSSTPLGAVAMRHVVAQRDEADAP